MKPHEHPMSRTVELAWVFAAALVFYNETLAPSVVWGDSASLGVEAVGRSLTFGTAGDHPFFVLAASLLAALPGDVARHVNLASAVFGALAVMLVYRCGRLLGASRLASATGAAAARTSATGAFIRMSTLPIIRNSSRFGSSL